MSGSSAMPIRTPLVQGLLAACPALGLVAAMVAAIVGLMTLVAWPAPAWSHPGKLDKYGGHFNEKTDTYHYHRPRGLLSKNKKGFINWAERDRSGEVRGKIVKIERPDAVWLRVTHRPAYQDLSRLLSGGNRSNKDQLVKIWFLHVSPEASVNLGKKYNAWFRKKVKFELGQKLIGKEVVVQFRIVQQGQRMYAMVFLGEENINLWLVLNGWSYHLLNQGENPYEKDFLRAEMLAKKRKVGLWRGNR